MPEKGVIFHRNDPPWITEDFKRVIKHWKNEPFPLETLSLSSFTGIKQIKWGNPVVLSITPPK
jgi:hypothetical protein